MSSLTKHELLVGKLVQEIAKNGDQIPEIYIDKKGFPKAIDVPKLWRDNLLIDYSLLSSSSASELAKLRSALNQWGCFQVINHGIESTFLEELIEVSKQFFALPLEEKMKCSSEGDMVEGYGSDALYSKAPDWNDRLFLTLCPKESLKLECWPKKPEKFREILVEYSEKLSEVNDVLCKAMSRSLDLDENRLNFGKNGPSRARLTLYPSCASPDRVLGTKPHADGTNITYLLPQTDVEGLQILKDDQWYKVAVTPGAIFINFGDLGEVMTNGVFKSAVHRVTTNNVKDRISVAVFFTPENDAYIEPLSELVTAHQPQVYKKFHISEYWPKFYETFTYESRALDAFRV